MFGYDASAIRDSDFWSMSDSHSDVINGEDAAGNARATIFFLMNEVITDEAHMLACRIFLYPNGNFSRGGTMRFHPALHDDRAQDALDI